MNELSESRLSESNAKERSQTGPAPAGPSGRDAYGERESTVAAFGESVSSTGAPGSPGSTRVRSARLSATNLGHRFGPRVLFRMLSVELQGGRPLAVTGANGSGKSTLMRILAGVLRPSRGEVELEVDGRKIAVDDRPLACGMVAPYLNVYDHFTPEENLHFICRVRGLVDEKERARYVLDRVGLYDRRDDQVRTFSSGMLQRVRFACALVADPPVLVLDEPTATLDEKGVHLVHDITDAALEAGTIVVIATNEKREAERCDDRIRIEDFAP